MSRVFRGCNALCLAVLVTTLFAWSCSSQSNPTSPTGGTGSGGGVTSSVTTPSAVSPAVSAQIRNADQPITLTVGNAVLTQGVTPTYTFEVASDAAFSTKIVTKSGVAQGTNGHTSVAIDLLPAGADYFWHARAEGGGTTGPFSGARKMTIGAAVALGAPTAISPTNGATAAGWPTFTIANASRSGPVGNVVYRFEVSTTTTFTSLILTGVVPEGTNQTSFTPPGSQAPPPMNTTLYWRATAIDQTNGVTGPVSIPQSFTAAQPSQAGQIASQLGVALWPGIQPPGTPGRATLGGNWGVQSIVSFNGVAFVSPTLEELQVFDLIDRGMNPDAAISWMRSNGYATSAAYYPSINVIGFPFEYMTLLNGAWDLVVRIGG